MVLTRSMRRALDAERVKAAKRVAYSATAMAGQQFARTAGKMIAKNVVQGVVRSARRRGRSSKKVLVKKKAKTSKFERKVKQVLRKEKLADGSVGVYRKHYTGFSLIPGNGNYGNNKVSTELYRQTATGVNTAIKSLDFFTPNQLIDAASVLYNNKIGAINADTYLTGNFTDANLKFYLKSAYAKVTFKNVGTATLDFKVYEVNAKNLELDTFYNDWVDSMEATNLKQPAGLGTAGVDTYGVEPTMIEPLLDRYKIQTHRKILQPGDSYAVVLRIGPFNFEKGKVMDADTLQKYAKFSKQLVYSFNAMPTLHWDSTSDLQVTGRAIGSGDVSTTTYTPRGIVIDVAEKFVLQPPDITPEGNMGNRYGWLQDQDVFGKTSLTEISEITKDYQRQTTHGATAFSTTA